MKMKSQTKAFKKGMIILWSGLIADIPGGWHLCDGTTGTPNLKNSFVVGAGDTYVVGATGGSSSHYHTGTTDFHGHDIAGGAEIPSGSGYNNYVDQVLVNFTTQSTNSLPPYYALAYIMKL